MWAGVDVTETGADRFEARRRQVGLLLAPMLFGVVLLLPAESLTAEGHRLAAIMALVVTLWVTEAIPLAVTALLGPMLAVILQVAPAGEAFAPMANPTIFLFLGSFILAQGLLVHGVNERIAYGVLSWKLIGARPTRILIAYGALAAFLSAWMSDTATAAMLVPIGMSLVAFMESEGKLRGKYGTALMLMTAYGCTRGGMATPVGTPPNLIAIGMLSDLADVRITFVEWMLIGVPLTLVLMGIVFVYLAWVGRTGVAEIGGAYEIIAERKRALGPWKRGEKNALLAFGVTICLWIGPGLLPLILGREHPFTEMVLASMPEAVAALTGAVLLFLLPVSKTQRSTITWRQAAQIDWGTILLVWRRPCDRGPIGLHRTGSDDRRDCPPVLLPTDDLVSLTFAAAGFTVLMTEVMSNTAATTIAVPIVISIAQASGVDPVAPAVASGLAASVAALLPVSTPPNAIAYASGLVKITDMIKYGLAMDAVAVLVVPTVVLLVR